jgi:large subunit ribosomal protein L4
MALCEVVNTSAEKVGDVELKDELFGVTVQPGILHEVVCMQRANRRRGTASTKTRGEVSGGGAKPWKQKGPAGPDPAPGTRRYGAAAVFFGPRPRDYSYKLPKKVRRLAFVWP